MPFQKGNKLGKGRPPVGTSIAEYIRHLGGENGKAYVDKLHALAVEPHENTAMRLSAIQVLLNRGFGQVPQTLDIGNKDDKPFGVNHLHEK